MQSAIDIARLSKEEKLRIMEDIWEDLSREEEEVDSPKWHRKALVETEMLVNSGREKAVDWENAKKQLRKRFE